MTKIVARLDIGHRIVMRVYHSGGAHDYVRPLRRNPANPVEFGGFAVDRNFHSVEKLAIRVAGKELVHINLEPRMTITPSDVVWFCNRVDLSDV
jgi:hypothetical protein